MIEVEVKVSKADLNNDFKKRKHRIYEQSNSKWTPHQFYFAVPEELVEYAVAKCVGTKYGIMKISDNNAPIEKRCRIIKRAKDLHTKQIDSKVVNTIIRRMSSELANFYQRIINEERNKS